MQIVVLNVSSIKKNLSKINIIESHQQRNKCTFATTTLSYQGHGFFWIYGQVESSKDPILFSCRISEPYIFEFNFSCDIVWFHSHFMLILIYSNWINFWWLIDNCKDFLCCWICFSNVWSELLWISCLLSSKHHWKDCDKNIVRFKVLIVVLDLSSTVK